MRSPAWQSRKAAAAVYVACSAPGSVPQQRGSAAAAQQQIGPNGRMEVTFIKQSSGRAQLWQIAVYLYTNFCFTAAEGLIHCRPNCVGPLEQLPYCWVQQATAYQCRRLAACYIMSFIVFFRVICRGEVADAVVMDKKNYGFVTFADPKIAMKFLEVCMRANSSSSSSSLCCGNCSGQQW